MTTGRESLPAVQQAKARRDEIRSETGVCVREHRIKIRAEHIARHDALSALAYRLHTAGQISEDEAMLLYRKAEEEWDDAIHIASPDDPLVSLCGHRGRNLADLPTIPDGGSGCWTCIGKALELIPVEAREPLMFEAVEA